MQNWALPWPSQILCTGCGAFNPNKRIWILPLKGRIETVTDER